MIDELMMDDDPETVSHGAEPRTDDTTQDDDPVGGCMHGLPLALPTLGPIAGGEPGRGDVLVKDPSVVLRAMGETAAPPALPFERSEGGGRRDAVVGRSLGRSNGRVYRSLCVLGNVFYRVPSPPPTGDESSAGTLIWCWLDESSASERACVRACQPRRRRTSRTSTLWETLVWREGAFGCRQQRQTQTQTQQW